MVGWASNERWEERKKDGIKERIQGKKEKRGRECWVWKGREEGRGRERGERENVSGCDE